MFAFVLDLHPTFGAAAFPLEKRHGLTPSNSEASQALETYEMTVGGNDGAMLWRLLRPGQKSYKELGVVQASIQEVQQRPIWILFGFFKHPTQY
jgi:hypothetical protein